MTEIEQIEEELAKRGEHECGIRQVLVVTCSCGYVCEGIETFEEHVISEHVKK